MKAYTRRRFITSAKLGLAGIPFSVVLHAAFGREVTPGAFLMGFAFGFTVGVAELFVLKNRLGRLPFLLHLAAKSFALVAVMYVAFALLNLLDVVLDGISWGAYAEAIVGTETLLGITIAFGVIGFLLFFVHLDRLLGPGVLLGYVTGRYHHPRRERRIVMFLDLKGSTNLADSMTPDRYFDFLHHYFSEMSEPILQANAEIYQYVGDEVVLTWTMKSGLEEANCIRVFFLIEDQIRLHQQRFKDDYGAVPAFKAGVHAGEVIRAQIGELKSELVYNGDVLNTTARIQALCNPLGHKLLVSSDLVSHLSLGPEYAVSYLGSVSLRGKVEAMELSAIARTQLPGSQH